MRDHKKKKQTIIDFKGRSYQESEGQICINPTVIDDTRWSLKHVNRPLTHGLENRPRISVPMPKGQSTHKLKWDLQSFRYSTLTIGILM